MTGQRRDQILDAFMRIVADHGINRTTMRDVAREVGCSVGTIYNEFASREALIDALLERAQQEMDQLLKELSVSCQAPAEMRLRRFMIGFVQAVNLKMQKDRAFTEFVKEIKNFRHIGFKPTDLGKTIKLKVIGILEEILTQGVREGTFEIDNIPLTAKLVREAFTEYLVPFLTLEKTIEDIVEGAQAMMELIIKSIKAT
ncbi:TetR/AcrR family transcriptional regulator [Propionispora hippei]|uniref:Transcriptional regulator, TetR family n=1 Tax=Propionispora hippei DSM 15287 TaxID=1123003 RepID=A0A1M6DN03_9FIRM|nr:TetR/AcrR family transcriptional regulator [Propionispora hippei]SHI74667.1 transcriptional regulator, TetR family [Propionispora hippei DSM 15287]